MPTDSTPIPQRNFVQAPTRAIAVSADVGVPMTDFPKDPIEGQLYTDGKGREWVYDGAEWHWIKTIFDRVAQLEERVEALEAMLVL